MLGIGDSQVRERRGTQGATEVKDIRIPKRRVKVFPTLEDCSLI